MGADRVELSDRGAADTVALDARAASTTDGPPTDACLPGSTRDCGRNVGRCRAGLHRCGPDGHWGPCEGAVGPVAEVCNGADDDCNGAADEGFAIAQPCDGVGQCGAGQIECRSELLTRCSTDPGGSRAEDEVERCNDLDDDCDGQIDEGFPRERVCEGACGPGLTECSQAGDIVCSTDPTGTAHVVRAEVCNGADDDCDGHVDEGFDLGEPCEGVGECGTGIVECANNGAARCSSDSGGSESGARPEICNALDDDCDGGIDEGFAIGQPCTGLGVCGDGFTECGSDGELTCSTEPGGSNHQSVSEVCNSLDDDCDGEVDEGFGLGDLCNAQGVCNAGFYECNELGDVVCDTAPGGSRNRSRPEECNGIDDDCDGDIDESFNLGGWCDGEGACGVGELECGNGGVICNTEPAGSNSQAGEERCDGLDNDCNGLPDDGEACGGDTCATAPLLQMAATTGGVTVGLANDYEDSTCLGRVSGPDQVFRFEPPVPGDYVVGVAPSDPQYDVVVWIAQDCENLGACLIGGDRAPAGRAEAVFFHVAWADALFVVVDDRMGMGGPFSISLRPVADGERCGNAIRLPLPGRFVGTTKIPRQNDVQGVACPVGRNTGGVDQVFRLDVPQAGTLRITVTPGPADSKPIIYVVESCADVDGSCVAAAGSALPGEPETLEAQVAPGTYFLVVDHEGNLGGAFFLQAALDP